MTNNYFSDSLSKIALAWKEVNDGGETLNKDKTLKLLEDLYFGLVEVNNAISVSRILDIEV